MNIAHSFLDPSSRWYYPLRWTVLVLLGLAIYAQVFGFNFVFDDFDFIVNNPYIKRFDHIYYIWKVFPKTRIIGFYSFALNYLINRSHPQGYHIFNFIVHLVAVGLVWALATVIFKIAGVRQPELPFVIAVLFLVHPCQTQAVTYISQRFESMLTVFYLGTIYCYLCGRISSSNTHKVLLFICSAGFAILGIFTKEGVATIPFMILAVESILLNRGALNFKRFLSWPRCLPIIILGVMFAFLFMKMLGDNLIHIYFRLEPSASHDGDMITGGKYVLTQMRVFLTFLRLLILPVNQNLDYDYPLSTGPFDPPLTLVGMGVIALMVFLIFKLRKAQPLIAFGMAWILITFSVNVAPRVNVIFEHKLYLISFGFFLAAVYILSTIIKDRKILFGLLITIITALSLVSYQRNQVWKNQLTLWEDTVRKSPHKARPYNNRGLAYFYQGNLTQAISDYSKAIEIKPNYAEAYINRGLIYYNQGKLTQAIYDYDKAIEISPKNAQALNDRGILYSSQGNLTKAIPDYNKAIERDPNYAEAYYNRGNIYDEEGDLSQALSDYDQAIEMNFTGAYYNRGLLFAKQGHYVQAIFDFTKAIEMEPENAEIYISRGFIHAQRSDFAQAVSDYNKAIEINPDNAQAYNNLGLIYYDQGDLTQAMADYNQAIALNPHYAQVYYNRSVIYYRLKEYDKAWEDVQKTRSFGLKVDPKFLEDLKKYYRTY